MTEEKPLFEMAHTRVQAQRDRMEECARLGICPFCWEHLDKYHDAPVIKKGGWWAITENDHPYTGTRFHYLAIYKHHIFSIDQIEAAGAYELLRLFSWLCDKFGIQGATILFRTGNMKYTGATLGHLHAHIISGVARDEVDISLEPKDLYILSTLGYKKPK